MIELLRAQLAEPTSKGLTDAIARAVASGSVADGTRLPPIRQVARELQLSPTTVSAAWSTLRRAGTIHTDGRRGSFVRAPRAGGGNRYRRAVGSPVSFGLDLSTGVPDPGLLPALGPALGTLADAPVTHSYLDDPVLAQLGECIARTWPFAAERLTVVDGATDAVSSILNRFGAYGVRVAVEDPAFPPFLDLLEAAGMQPVPVSLDDEGPMPDPLTAAVRDGAGLFVMQPRGQNPTGVTMSPRRCEALARVLADTETIVVEDDSLDGIADTALTSIGVHLPDRVLHVRSFSKAFGPDLRLAAIGGPAVLVDPIERSRQLGQGWSSRLLQRLLLELLTDPSSRRQVDAARRIYAQRRNQIIAALRSHGVRVGGDDGINIWLPVLDEVAALQSLAAAGIGAAPGSPFQVSGGQEPHVRVTVGLVDEPHDGVLAALIAATRAGGTISR